MKKWNWILLLVLLPAVYWVGVWQGKDSHSPEEKVLEVEDKVPVDPMVAKRETLEEKLLSDPNVAKATYKLSDLPRFQNLPERSRKQPVPPTSAEGKAKKNELLKQKMDVALRQIQRLRQDEKLLETWSLRIKKNASLSEDGAKLESFITALKNESLPPSQLVRDYFACAEVLR